MGIKAFLLAALCASSIVTAKAEVVSVAELNRMEMTNTLLSMSLIEWKVGDSQDYGVSIGFGMKGTLHKEAVREDNNGAAIWVKQEMKLPVANDTSEVLYDRDSGKVLKYMHNGKEEQMPDDEVEIISTETTTVQVPAGKFKCLHVVAKTKKISKIELWANPRDISLDGAAKMFMDQGMMKVNMELTSFKKN